MTALTKHEPRASSLDDMRTFAEVAVRSRFYGFKSAEEMLPLMIIAQSQGRSFTSVVEEYSVINGRPALKAESMLARFQKAGGHIKWTELSDTRCAAVFSHPQCDPVEVDWDMDRAKAAGLAGRDMWKKFARNMLKARVISDGVRTAFPACLGGVYTPEEVGDMDTAHVSPPPPRGQLAAPEEPGQVETPREPSFHDQPSNVPGGFKSLKSIQVDEEQRTDHRQDPEWSVLSTDLTGNCESRSDVLAWWEARKKDLKQRKPHFAKAFYQGEVLPFAASFAQTVEWEDEAGARG
jgi:hypothetical protein